MDIYRLPTTRCIDWWFVITIKTPIATKNRLLFSICCNVKEASMANSRLIVLLAKNDSAERFGPSSGSIKCRAWSGSKPFDALVMSPMELSPFMHKLLVIWTWVDCFACKKRFSWTVWPNSGSTKCRAWSGSRPFDALVMSPMELSPFMYLDLSWLFGLQETV